MFGRHPPPRRHGLLLSTPLDNSEQCRNCAADCCRGFPSVELSADEYAILQKLGAIRLEFTLTGHFYLLIENPAQQPLCYLRAASFDLPALYLPDSHQFVILFYSYLSINLR